jgi:RHS repeat-associated protein
VTDEAGNNLGLSASAYMAFGGESGRSGSAAELNPGYNGHESSGGLVYMRNRWYDPNTGRFTQEDPIGYAGGINLYGYVGNNPVSYTDPFGLCPDSLKNDDGECPGGLSEQQWRRIEYAANNRMTKEARELVLGALNAGKISPGLNLLDKVLSVIKGGEPAGVTNTITDNIRIAEKAFKYGIGDFAFLLAHEAQHTQQPFLMLPGAKERDADAFGCANTWGRVGYFAGGYGNCGGPR